VIDARERRSFARAFGLALAITFAFGAPATLKLLQGQLAPTETLLGEAITAAFGGITLPVVAAAVSASVLGNGSVLRAHVDRLVAAGVEPRAVIGRPIAIAAFAAASASALGAALTLVLLRAALHLGGPGLVLTDLLATAWGALLGAAAWTAASASFVVRSGRPVLAWLVVPLDLCARLLPGAAAWIGPSAHVENVLGAPPPRGVVHVPILAQPASVLVLTAVAVAAAIAARRRYAGRWRR
jgi:hypothetical protein